MIEGGTLNDFYNAIINSGGGRETEEIILYLRQDWISFLKLVNKLGELVGLDMAEINSLLLESSLSICTQRNHLGILP